MGHEASWPNFRQKNLWATNTNQTSRASQENRESELNYLVIIQITNYSPPQARWFVFITRLISILKCQIIVNRDCIF